VFSSNPISTAQINYMHALYFITVCPEIFTITV